MAITRAGRQWVLAIVLLILVVVFAEWLAYRFHALSDFSNKDKAQYELKK